MHDNRRYVRMGTVFPVEFSIVAPDGPDPRRLLQGFTRDVSEGGMCIEFKSFGKETEARLNTAGASLDLTINPTFSRDPIRAHARIIWLKKEPVPDAKAGASPAKYWIGVSYESIEPSARRRLIAYAKRMQRMPGLVAFTGIALLSLLSGLALHNQSLARENLRLEQQLREGVSQRSVVAGELVVLSDSRRSLEGDLGTLRQQIGRLEKAAAEELMGNIAQANALKESAAREAMIQRQLDEIRQSQDKLRESYRTLEKQGLESGEAARRWMLQWLSSHQNLKTGLVASFEGDPALEDTAFTYDQSLAAQAFLVGGEPKRAQQVLSFFESRAQNWDGAYANAYDTIGGQPKETVVHVGPNLWIGIAALQYQRFTGDNRFVPMAERIGDWAIRLQDAEGGIPGGPGVPWFSTEHNLDAYAFFGMLHRAGAGDQYGRAQAAVLDWLKKYAYSNKGPAVNRGKGDATIATDTFGWSIAAIGPAKLIEMGFDPEAILRFAEEHCEVTVPFRQPDGKTVQVRGFDFAKAQHVGRGGILSTEWTAQMIVGYQVVARHFEAAGDAERAGRYLEKANLFLSELQKMLITSPSRTGQGRGCLPYASIDNVDTGHGWRTPSGPDTGSVAATAYGLFAWNGYNPFERTEARDAGL